MAESLLGGLGNYLPSMQILGVFILCFFVFMFFILIIIIFVVSKRKIPLNLYMARAGDSSYRLVKMTAKKVFTGGVTKLKIWRMGIIDKRIPHVESDYLYPTKRGKDVLNLLVDSKGFIHKIRIPPLKKMIDYLVYESTFKELINHDPKLTKEDKERIKALHETKKAKFTKDNPDYEIFLAPNPHETMEYVARQVQKGREKYASTFLEKWGYILNPIAAMLVSLMMIVMAMIFSGKILGV